mgnify:CR=1 FL=1
MPGNDLYSCESKKAVISVCIATDAGGGVGDSFGGAAAAGRNLTGETGTYRWMAPEVIRHEAYFSLADV